MMYDNTEKLPRAILVGVDTGEYNAEISLLELEELELLGLWLPPPPPSSGSGVPMG